MLRSELWPSIIVALSLAAGPALAADQAQPQPWQSGPMGPGMMGQGMMGGGMMGGGMMGRHLMQRHMAFMHNGVPPQYASLANPLQPTPTALARGAELYAANCASCHGPQGHGDGEAGKDLSPQPSDIAATAHMPMPDSFFVWTISEGGQQFGTAMPPFRDSLKPEDIWAIITYLRAGLPSHDAGR